MGRSYWFECSRCGYRTAVSGKPDRGHDFFVETISCDECKKLYDAVVKLRVMAPHSLKATGMLNRSKAAAFPSAPTFQAALARLPVSAGSKHRWRVFKATCPVSEKHHVKSWRDPGACPRCGLILEKNPLPYRIWE